MKAKRTEVGWLTRRGSCGLSLAVPLELCLAVAAMCLFNAPALKFEFAFFVFSAFFRYMLRHFIHSVEGGWRGGVRRSIPKYECEFLYALCSGIMS